MARKGRRKFTSSWIGTILVMAILNSRHTCTISRHSRRVPLKFTFAAADPSSKQQHRRHDHGRKLPLVDDTISLGKWHRWRQNYLHRQMRATLRYQRNQVRKQQQQETRQWQQRRRRRRDAEDSKRRQNVRRLDCRPHGSIVTLRRPTTTQLRAWFGGGGNPTSLLLGEEQDADYPSSSSSWSRTGMMGDEVTRDFVRRRQPHAQQQQKHGGLINHSYAGITHPLLHIDSGRLSGDHGRRGNDPTTSYSNHNEVSTASQSSSKPLTCWFPPVAGITMACNSNLSKSSLSSWRVLRIQKTVGYGAECYAAVRDRALAWDFVSADGRQGLCTVSGDLRRYGARDDGNDSGDGVMPDRQHHALAVSKHPRSISNNPLSAAASSVWGKTGRLAGEYFQQKQQPEEAASLLCSTNNKIQLLRQPWAGAVAARGTTTATDAVATTTASPATNAIRSVQSIYSGPGHRRMVTFATTGGGYERRQRQQPQQQTALSSTITTKTPWWSRLLPVSIYSYNPVVSCYDVVDQRGPDCIYTSTAYATAAGHWLCGEERVTVRMDDSDRAAVRVEIVSLSRPAPTVMGHIVWPFVANLQRSFFQEQMHQFATASDAKMCSPLITPAMTESVAQQQQQQRIVLSDTAIQVATSRQQHHVVRVTWW